MKLFQYAVILHPTEKEKEDGAKSKLIVNVMTVLAKDAGAAALLAARAIPAEYVEKLDQVEVAVRPF